jgi:hypothetical protein
MSPPQPKLIIGRTGANTFKFSLRTEHASLTGELSISLGENVPDQRTSEEKRKFFFQRLDALAQAFSNAIRTEAAVGRK